MEKFLQDVRYAFRVLLKNPGFSAVAIISLALGIGANTTIFTVVNAILLNPLPVKDAGTLVEVDTIDSKTRVTQANTTKLGVSYPNFQDYARDSQAFAGIACFVGPAPLTWSNGVEPKQVQGELASANYFDVLGVKPAAGRFFFPDEDRKLGGNNVVVLSYAFWADKLGSDAGILGKTLNFNATPYTVIGVAPPNFKGTFAFASAEQIWIPVSMYPSVLTGLVKEIFDDRRFLGTTVVARLKPDVAIGQAQASLTTLAGHLETEYPKDNAGRSVALTPLAEAAVGANNFRQTTRAGALMMGVVGLVLLIACVNLANLLLAQAARREREMGLRAALGASRARVLRQFLTESLVLAVLGAAAGLIVASAGRTALWSLRPPFIKNNDLKLTLDSHVLLFTLAIAVLTAVLIGLGPAYKASRASLAEILKAGGRGGTIGWRRNPLRSLLVVCEIALAFVALVCAGLFIRSMQRAQKLNLGFESERLLVMSFDVGALHYNEGQGQQYFRAVVDAAKSTPGVAAATVASNVPLGGGFLRTVFPEGETEASGYRGTLTQVDDIAPDYFATLRVSRRRGRVFTDADREHGRPVAIANEAMARHFWPNQNALGKRFHFFGDAVLREIVGVVGNTTENRIGEQPQPIAYLPMTQDYSPAATLAIRSDGPPDLLLSAIRSKVQAVDRNIALTNVQTVRVTIGQALWAPRMGAALLTVFGGLALILAAVGVYGVISYSVAQQTREIGVRVALGAESGQVLRLIVAQGLRLTAFGVLGGIAAALIATRLLSSLLFDVSTHDPATFGSIGAVLAVTAMLACYVPARRATRVDPIIALREE